MNYISDVLFWISTGMLVPVIILLIFFFLRALLLLGGFFGQYLVKRKTGAEIREQMNTLTGEYQKQCDGRDDNSQKHF